MEGNCLTHKKEFQKASKKLDALKKSDPVAYKRREKIVKRTFKALELA